MILFGVIFWTDYDRLYILLFFVEAASLWLLIWAYRKNRRFMNLKIKEFFVVVAMWFVLLQISFFATSQLYAMGFGWFSLSLYIIFIALTFYAKLFPWQWKNAIIKE
jgi:hypothetical protein